MSPKVINCPHCGQVLPEEFWHEKNQVNKIAVKCPRCGSIKNWKDAKQYRVSGDSHLLALENFREIRIITIEQMLACLREEST